MREPGRHVRVWSGVDCEIMTTTSSFSASGTKACLRVLAASCVLTHCLLAIDTKAPPKDTAPALILACSPERPTVFRGEKVQLRAWAAGSAKQLQYRWSVSAGQILGQGATLQWDFADVQTGIYEASVTASDGVDAPTKCTLQVAVENRPRDVAPNLETGRAFLVKGKSEMVGYGLYSYLLLGSPVTESSRDRFLGAIDAYLRMIGEIERFGAYFDAGKLNVTYLPVTAPVSEAIPSAQWILDNYDYARARAVLDLLPGTHREGPYIVSLLKPATKFHGSLGPYLVQDLSTVPTKPPELISWWIREFLDQAAQEHFWQPKTLESLVLKLRTTVAIVAVGVPEVKRSLGEWILLKHDSR